MRLVLWRHGRTGHNARNLWQGHLDVPLDDVGLDQARRAAATLAARCGDSLARIVASDLRRATATAAALAERTGARVITDRRLREMHVGVWQGRSTEEILAGPEAGTVHAWRAGGADVRAGGPTGETRREAVTRALAALQEARAGLGGDDVLVVAAHGAVLKGVRLELTGEGLEAWGTAPSFGNACWVELVPAGPVWAVAGAGGPGPDDAAGARGVQVGVGTTVH